MPYPGGEMYFAQPEFPNPEIRKMLEEIVPPDKTIRYEHRLLLGSAADEIVRLAAEENVNMIVIGSHGRTGLTRVLMGSVAESVTRKATCPVLTLKEANETPNG